MAALQYWLRARLERGIVARGAVPLCDALLERPRIEVGRDRLWLQGCRAAFELPATWGWEAIDGRIGELAVNLLDPGSGRPAWRGVVSGRELRRIGRRAVLALGAAGAIADCGRLQLGVALQLAERDPSRREPARQDAVRRALPAPVVVREHLPGAVLCAATAPDVVVALAASAHRQVAAAAATAARRGEPSTLSLLGRRGALACGSGRVPCYAIAACEPPPRAPGEATPPAALLGELHVRVAGDSLWASDTERRACEELGPAAILITVRAGDDPWRTEHLRVYAFLARGELELARVTVAMAPAVERWT
ncbi:MAG: hypothetical protein U1E76_04030 [Planctomycetota bacterium]